MPGWTLRIKETAESTSNTYQVKVTLDEGARKTPVNVPLTFEMTQEDRDNLRWYLEDYLKHPEGPAPEQAARIEKRMQEMGDALAQAVLFGNQDALWRSKQWMPA